MRIGGARSFLGSVLPTASRSRSGTRAAGKMGGGSVAAVGPRVRTSSGAALAVLTQSGAPALRQSNSLPSLDRMPTYRQTGNGCGTTSLAMITTYLTGQPVTQVEVDNSVRRMDVFVSPQDLIDEARERGLAAEGYNKGTWQEVRAMIDRGHPVEALINSKGEYNRGVDGLHYVVVTGYDRKAGTVTFRDPNGWDKTVTVQQFEGMWKGVGFGFENYFMAIGRPGALLPAGRHDGVEAVVHTLNGVTNVTNGLNRIGSPDSAGDVAQGVVQFVGGAVQTVVSGLAALIALGADGLANWIGDTPVLSQIFKPVLGVVGAAARAVSHVANGIGEGAQRLGSAFKSLFKGDLGGAAKKAVEGAGKVVEGVGKAVVSVIKGVGNAIKSLFSW